mgnify:CR=1 FL=1
MLDLLFLKMENKKENKIYSPLSIKYALSMLKEGTNGESQKQIINYIHKLNKELKKLPYNYGAEFGYSIIENNLKTVEDALSEAIEDMKRKKESGKSEK